MGTVGAARCAASAATYAAATRAEGSDAAWLYDINVYPRAVIPAS